MSRRALLPGRVFAGVLTGVVLLGTAVLAGAQVQSIPPPSRLPQYNSTLGFGASYGPFLNRDADFWGLAVDCGRRLGAPGPSAPASPSTARPTAPPRPSGRPTR